METKILQNCGVPLLKWGLGGLAVLGWPSVQRWFCYLMPSIILNDLGNLGWLEDLAWLAVLGWLKVKNDLQSKDDFIIQYLLSFLNDMGNLGWLADVGWLTVLGWLAVLDWHVVPGWTAVQR